MSSVTSVKLDPDLKDRLEKIAESQGRTPHYLMREAIREFVSRQEQRQLFLQEAEAAWQHYRQTGLHVTAGEVAEWLKTWGTDDEREGPECHR